MPWFRAHGAHLVALIAVVEITIFATLGHAHQYGPSLLAAKFVSYPLYLILPALTSCATGIGLRAVPEDMESVSSRPTALLAMIYVSATTLSKCILASALFLLMPQPQIRAYIFNTVVFVGLAVLLPLPARMTIWIPVVAFYLCIFLGASDESVQPWAVLALPEASGPKVACGATFCAFCIAAMLFRYRGVRSARP